MVSPQTALRLVRVRAQGGKVAPANTCRRALKRRTSIRRDSEREHPR